MDDSLSVGEENESSISFPFPSYIFYLPVDLHPTAAGGDASFLGSPGTGTSAACATELIYWRPLIYLTQNLLVDKEDGLVILPWPSHCLRLLPVPFHRFTESSSWFIHSLIYRQRPRRPLLVGTTIIYWTKSHPISSAAVTGTRRRRNHSSSADG